MDVLIDHNRVALRRQTRVHRTDIVLTIIIHDVVGRNEGGHIATCLCRQIGVELPVIFLATSTVDAKSAFEASASKTVTLGLNGGLEATGNDVVWFRVMSERAWAAGETASFEVITDKGVYKKEVTLPSDIKFPDGGLTKFGVGLAANKVNPVDVPFLWDFEDGADGWTFIDNDGDGYNWFPYAVGGISGNNSLVSQSYASSVLYPDNWAFSPAVQLTEDNYLSFWVKAYAADWPAEHLSRRILLMVP